MDYIRAFICGGIICVIGQVLMDKTKLTAARILVLFVVAGCILGALGIYESIVDFGGAGATVPLPGFGYLLARGVMQEVSQFGVRGIFTGGLRAAAGGVTVAVLSGFLCAVLFNPKEKT